MRAVDEDVAGLEIRSISKTDVDMDISVIIPTVGQDTRLERLRRVIETAASFGCVREIVMVWQGDPASPFLKDLPAKVRIVLCETRALAYARNRGVEFARASYIWFLDDDTIPLGEYPTIATEYLTRGYDFVHANVVTSGAKRSQVSQAVLESIPITRKTAPGNAWEPGLFMRRDEFLSVKFDETLGVGCLLGASEGLDFAMRLLALGLKGLRAKDLILDHPEIPFDQNYANKVALYSLGNSHVAIRHRMLGQYIHDLCKALALIVISLMKGNTYEVRVWAIRFLALGMGPMIKPQPPFVFSAETPKEMPRGGSAQEAVHIGSDIVA